MIERIHHHPLETAGETAEPRNLSGSYHHEPPSADLFGGETEQDESSDEENLKETLAWLAKHKLVRYLVALTAVNYALRASLPQHHASPDAPATQTERANNQEKVLSSIGESEYYQNPAFFGYHPNGEYTAAEKAERTRTYDDGTTLFRDAGATFFLTRPGHSSKAQIIRDMIGLYEREYDYLERQTNKINSFNIHDGEIKPGMYLPLPTREEDRQLSDEQFLIFAERAVAEIRKHPKYGPFMERILQKTSVDDLLLTLLAVAKQECGGAPLGQFEFHRHEPRRDAFSFSLFHLLMYEAERKDAAGKKVKVASAGLKARRALGLTEGQLYHPENAVMAFMGFIIERAQELKIEPTTLFPIIAHHNLFAKFYNGKAWENRNPDYVYNILRYYRQALEKVGMHAHQDTAAALEKLDKLIEIEKNKLDKRLAEKEHRQKQKAKQGTRNKQSETQAQARNVQLKAKHSPPQTRFAPSGRKG